MTFVQIEKRNGMINLDGYSRNKTLKGALKDLAREVAKIDEGEGNIITENIDEYVGMIADGMINEPGCYYIEAEEVHCASRYSEKNDEMEYAEGHWYLYIRFCAPEQESEETEIASVEADKETETAPVANKEMEVKDRALAEVEQYMDKHQFLAADKKKVRDFIRSQRITSAQLTRTELRFVESGVNGVISRSMLGVQDNFV